MISTCVLCIEVSVTAKTCYMLLLLKIHWSSIN